MKNSEKLWYNQPASRFVEALPLGNGKLGMMDYGNGMFTLNEESIWSGKPVLDNGVMNQEALQEVRRLIVQEEFEKAENLMADKLQGPYKQTYLPLGKLSLTMNDDVLKGTYRQLDIEKGITSAEGVTAVGGQAWQLQAGILRQQNVGLIRYRGQGELTVNFYSKLLNVPFLTESEQNFAYRVTCPVRVPSYEEAEQPIVYNLEEDTVRAVFWVEIRRHEEGCDYLFSVETNYLTGGKLAPVSFEEMASVAQARVAQITEVDQVWQQHQEHYQSLFGRSVLRLDDNHNSDLATDLRRLAYRSEPTDYSLIALYYHYGRYLLYSSAWLDSLPANLQGIWNEKLKAPWCSNYTTNINLEMNYWPAEISRVEEAHDSLAGLLVAMYQNQGGDPYVFHHNLDCWLTSSPVNGSPSWAFWPMAPVWLSLHLFEIKKRRNVWKDEEINQVLQGVAEFLSDWLWWGDDEKYHLCPSTSPENQYKTLKGYISSISDSTTVDIMLAKSFSQRYSEWTSLNQATVNQKEVAEKLANKVAQLPEIPIHPDGYLQEWQHRYEETEQGHRHLSHLIGYFPDDYAFGLGEVYLNASKKALARRTEEVGDFTSWHCAWGLCLFSRFRQAEKVKDYLNIMVGQMTCPNLFSSYMPNRDGEELFQLDGNLGGVRAITEMIVQQIGDEIILLPVIEAIIPKGSIDCLKIGRGHLLNVSWGEKIELVVEPACDDEICFICQDKKRRIEVIKGKKQKIIFEKTKK